MKNFLSRWSPALAATAAVSIVLTAGAVMASDQSSSSTDPSADVVTVLEQSNALLDSTTDGIAACPPIDVDVDADADVSTSRPGDVGTSPASDDADDADGTDVDVTVGVQPDPSVSSGAGGSGGSDDAGDGAVPAGDEPTSDSEPAVDVDVDVDDQPEAPAPTTPDTGDDADEGDVPQDTDATRTQLVDLDGLLGSSGLALDIPSSDGTLVNLDLGAPAADDPATVSVIDATIDGNDLDGTDVDVDGRPIGLDVVSDDLVETGLLDTGLTGTGLLDTGLLDTGLLNTGLTGTDGALIQIGTVNPQPVEQPRGDDVAIIDPPTVDNDSGDSSNGSLIGDITVVDAQPGSSPLVDTDAPISVD